MTLMEILTNGEFRCLGCDNWYRRDTGHQFYECIQLKRKARELRGARKRSLESVMADAEYRQRR